MIVRAELQFPATVQKPTSSARSVPMTALFFDDRGRLALPPGNEAYVRGRNPASGAVVASILTTRAGVALSTSAVAHAPSGAGWLVVPNAANVFPFAASLAYDQPLMALDVDVLVGSASLTRFFTQQVVFESAGASASAISALQAAAVSGFSAQATAAGAILNAVAALQTTADLIRGDTAALRQVAIIREVSSVSTIAYQTCSTPGIAAGL